MKQINLFHYLSFLISIKLSYALYRQTPTTSFSYLPDYNDTQKLQILLSPNAQTIAIKYYKTSQQQTYIKYLNMKDGQNLCTNHSKDFNLYYFVRHSFQAGPITVRISQNSFIPQIWSTTCQIQHEWKNVSSNAFSIIQNGTKGYISFSQQDYVSQYDLYTKVFIRKFLPREGEVFLLYNIYADNHQYLVVRVFNDPTRTFHILGLDPNTGNQSFLIDQNILPLKFVQNNSLVIMFNLESRQFYMMSLDGHMWPTIKRQPILQQSLMYKICSQQNNIVFLLPNKLLQNPVLQIYNSNPQNKITNQIIQIIELDHEKFGNITNFDCSNNKIVVFNDKGMLWAFKYIQKLQDTKFSYLWVLMGAGGFVLILVVGIVSFFIYRRRIKNTNQIKDNQDDKIESLLQQERKMKIQKQDMLKSNKKKKQSSIVKQQQINYKNQQRYDRKQFNRSKQSMSKVIHRQIRQTDSYLAANRREFSQISSQIYEQSSNLQYKNGRQNRQKQRQNRQRERQKQKYEFNYKESTKNNIKQKYEQYFYEQQTTKNKNNINGNQKKNYKKIRSVIQYSEKSTVRDNVYWKEDF